MVEASRRFVQEGRRQGPPEVNLLPILPLAISASSTAQSPEAGGGLA